MQTSAVCLILHNIGYAGVTQYDHRDDHNIIRYHTSYDFKYTININI